MCRGYFRCSSSIRFTLVHSVRRSERLRLCVYVWVFVSFSWFVFLVGGRWSHHWCISLVCARFHISVERFFFSVYFLAPSPLSLTCATAIWLGLAAFHRSFRGRLGRYRHRMVIYGTNSENIFFYSFCWCGRSHIGATTKKRQRENFLNLH